MKEPFPSVECNPYSASSIFSLQCQVQAPAPVGPRLEILWFFINTRQDIVQISAATLTSFRSIVNQTGMSGQLLTSTITFGPFTNPIHAGGYFCRVALDGNTASFSASTAQVFDTETGAVLSVQPCGTQGLGHTQSDIMKCAGTISYFITSALAPSKTLSAIYMASLTITSTIPLSPPLAASNTTMLDSQGETTISQLYMASLTITSTIPLSPPLAASNTSMLDFQGETTISQLYMASLTITSTIPLSPPLAASNTTMLDSQGETTISQLQTSRPVPTVWVYILVGVVVLFFIIIIVLMILYIGQRHKKKRTRDFSKRKFCFILITSLHNYADAIQ